MVLGSSPTGNLVSAARRVRAPAHHQGCGLDMSDDAWPMKRTKSARISSLHVRVTTLSSYAAGSTSPTDARDAPPSYQVMVMSCLRSTLAVASAVMVLVVILPAALAQPEEPILPVHCQTWGAIGPGGTPNIAQCSLPHVTATELATTQPFVAELMRELRVDDLLLVTDTVDDQLSVLDGTIDASADPAANIENVYKGSTRLKGRGLRQALDFLGGDLPDGWSVTSGQDLGHVLDGPIDVFFFDTLGDPTTVPDGNRVFQVAFRSKDPAKVITPTVPETSALSGSRMLATAGQFPSAEGVRDFVAISDLFGKIGPDGETTYYNRPARIASIWTPDGVVIVTPSGLDPDGFRAVSYDAARDRWDLAPGPGGPLAFVPADGLGPGLFDWIGLAVKHEPIDGQDLLIDGAPQIDVTLPSHPLVPFSSILLAQTGSPPVIGLDLDLEGRTISFEELVAVVASDSEPLFVFQWGIPSYGRYCLTDAHIPAAYWSDGERFTEEDSSLARAGPG